MTSPSRRLVAVLNQWKPQMRDYVTMRAAVKRLNNRQLSKCFESWQAMMEELMERYRVFMKRFELSEDFQAKLTVEQLRTQLGQFGITPEQMFEQMHGTLERMKSQLDLPPS